VNSLDVSVSRFVLLVVLLLGSTMARANLVIEITRGVDNPTAIAIVPFSWSGDGFLAEDVPGIVSADLNRSGQFRTFAESEMPLAKPHVQEDIVYGDWRKYGMEYIVIGRVEPQEDRPGYRIFFELYDVHGGQQVFSKVVKGGSDTLRDLAHYISDKVYETLTGYPGHFSTQVAYIQSTLNYGEEQFQLLLADQDGARVRTLLTSNEPIMSPSWSPDGKEIAYVSFEGRKPAIYRQVLSSGSRQRITNFPGLNSAPAWSPDGTRMAMVLSKDENPELYVMDLASGMLTRLTNHFAIDTEPYWWPDGKSIIFTSNRGGQPQIYRIHLHNREIERLTFDGSYNARGQVTPDGKHMVLVHRRNGIFHIAVQDFLTGNLHVLTKTHLDESPTLAPNGRMLMYATKEGNRGILSAVSLDGGVKVRLPSRSGDVREPAWSPFRH
jgi:TolB protein